MRKTISGDAEPRQELTTSPPEGPASGPVPRLLDPAVLASVVDQAHDAILVVDGRGAVLVFNQGAERLFQWTASEMRGQPLDRLLPPGAVAAHREHLQRFADGPSRSLAMSERAPIRGRRRDGTEFPAQASISKVDTPDGPLLTVIVSDLTDWERAEAVSHQATHDPLTGLPNRLLLGDRIGRALARRKRTGRGVAVLFLDLDRFKVVNDSLGHETGDRVLREAATRLTDAVREADTVARFGGDEFVVLCEDLEDVAEAGHVAQRIVGLFSEPFVIDGRRLHVHVSVGVALAPVETQPSEHTPEMLIRNADAAMYHAKEQGRGRMAFFDLPLRSRTLDRLDLERDLREAVDEGQLRLSFQPQSRRADGRVVGMRATLRWSHPVRGEVPQSSFVPVAEETGLIDTIRAWAVEGACRRLAGWRTHGLTHLGMTLDVSARELVAGELTGLAREALDREGIPRHHMTLEVTGSSKLHCAEVGRAMRAVREAGMRLGIDGLGTGNASMLHLRELPVDIVKIDRGFVAGLGDGHPADTQIVGSLIAVARALGSETLADGVDDEAQAAAAASLGCDYGEGARIGGPVEWPPLDPEPTPDR